MANVLSQPTDKQALDLTHAIALQESGKNGSPDYNAVGDNGTSHGAYQWQPGNFEAAAKEAGLNPTDLSPENQDKVAYYQIKKYKDEGYDPGQIASIWNSGSPNNWKDHSGTTVINGKPIHYDTPAYVNGVKQHYQQLAGMSQQPSGYVTQPNLPKETPEEQQAAQKQQGQEPSLGQELSSRGQDISHAAGLIGKGGIGNIASGALQVAGGVAGGVGDVTNKALELIPGVKLLESGLGKALGATLGAPGVKDVAAQVNQLAQEHPEIAKDIGAVVNIASVIPMFKGIGLAADAAKTAGAQALKGTLEKAATNEITGVATRTIPGRTLIERATQRGLNPVETLLKSDALPEVKSGSDGIARYNTVNAYHALSTAPDEAQLQQALARGASRVPLEESRQNALAAVEDEFKNRPDYDSAVKKVNETFDGYIKRYGTNPTQQEVNDMKRGVRESVDFNSPKLDSDVNYTIGQSLMDDIEQTAAKDGITEVGDINKVMSSKIEARKLLKLLNGKQVKLTPLEKGAKGLAADIAGGIGEFAGGITGIPFAGTLAGRAAGRGLLNREPGTILRNLQRARTGGSAAKGGKALRGILAPTVPHTLSKSQGQ